LYTAFGPYFLYQIMSYAIIATFSSQLRLGLQWRSTDLQRENGQETGKTGTREACRSLVSSAC
jgi:hypothetical protein